MTKLQVRIILATVIGEDEAKYLAFGALFCADPQSGPILTCVGPLASFGKLTYPSK